MRQDVRKVAVGLFTELLLETRGPPAAALSLFGEWAGPCVREEPAICPAEQGGVFGAFARVREAERAVLGDERGGPRLGEGGRRAVEGGKPTGG